jgi:uncharacterized protein YaaR (DUF327 family)
MAKKVKEETQTASIEAVEFSQSTEIVIVEVVEAFKGLEVGEKLEVSKNIAEILTYKKLVKEI